MEKSRDKIGIVILGICAVLPLCLKFGFTMNLLRFGSLTTILYSIAVVDFKKHKIPNKLIIIGGIVGVILRLGYFMVYDDWEVITGMVFGLLTGALPLMAVMLLSQGGMGAGDMKLMAMVGLWLGPSLCLFVMGLAFMMAAVVCIVLLITKKIDRKSKIPMAPFILAASIAAIYFNREILLYANGLF